MQSTPVAQVVVVDNASTDDSAAAARASSASVDVVVLRRNTGGAGGFAVGLARALERHAPDWVWLLDDDTIPTLTALEQLLATARAADAIVAGSRVAWTDGSDHPMNTPRRKPFVSRREAKRAEAAGGFPIRSTSFVSMLVRADAARGAGLPIADFFIWNDDFEYSTRLLRGGRGVFAPSSVVVHKTRVLGAVDADPGERFYFEVRNKIWMLRHSRSLASAEKALYGASTVGRWVRTVRRSANRGVVTAAFRRGWYDGWRTSPRSTTEVLADTVVAAEVERIERAARNRQ
jgi:GT2 family glycosyltransferase